MRALLPLLFLGLIGCLEAPILPSAPVDMTPNGVDLTPSTQDMGEDVPGPDCPTRTEIQQELCELEVCGENKVTEGMYDAACGFDGIFVNCGQCESLPGFLCQQNRCTCSMPDEPDECAAVECGPVTATVCGQERSFMCSKTCSQAQRCFDNKCIDPSFPGRLDPQSPRDSMRYGTAIARDGVWLAIGAPGARSGQGSVFLYRRSNDTWGYHSTVTVPTSTRGFGTALAIRGSLLAVGAPQENVDPNTSAGAVYILTYNETDWVITQRIEAPEPAGGLRLGEVLLWSHDTDGRDPLVDTLFIGAPQTDRTIENMLKPKTGQVHIVRQENGSWTIAETLDTPTGNAPEGGHFGASLAEGPSGLFIGAPSPDNLNELGSVYQYKRENGAYLFQLSLLGQTVEPEALFGATLSLNGNRLLVSSPGEIGLGTDAPRGVVYLFTRKEDGVWSQDPPHRERILPPRRVPDDGQFGYRAILQGPHLIVASDDAQGNGEVFSMSKVMDAWEMSTFWETPNSELYSESAPHELGKGLYLSEDILWLGAPGLGKDDSKEGYVFPIPLTP